MSADLSTTTARERVIRLFEGDGDRWDRWVTASPDATFCHLAGWRTVMREALGHEARYLIAEDDDGSWRGVLPLVRVRSRIFGRYLLSMPFLNYGGPLGDELARAALAAHAAELAREDGVRLLELRSRTPVPGPLARADRKITVLLSLPGTVDELWARTYKAKLRSQIRRPVKEGMTATFGVDLVEPFYEVFARNMRDLGTPVLPRRFFEGIARHLGEHAEFCVVWSNGRPVAAACGFVWRHEFEITWASSLREFSRSAPNMLLYNALMERMIDRGVGVFNFGRCTPGGGTHRFKLQWGGHDEPLPWAQWSPNGSGATPSPDRPLFRAATAVWQRLPLEVTRRVGPYLARSLP